mmetsp:Transcript_48447/g.138476  ORF Transcript_48447/g.138476 Transcript_48447/m.138476 type:complete len:318 (-) Transcript_48447:3-956(-)
MQPCPRQRPPWCRSRHSSQRTWPLKSRNINRMGPAVSVVVLLLRIPYGVSRCALRAAHRRRAYLACRRTHVVLLEDLDAEVRPSIRLGVRVGPVRVVGLLANAGAAPAPAAARRPRTETGKVLLVAEEVDGHNPQVVRREERLGRVLPHRLAGLVAAVVRVATGVSSGVPLQVLASSLRLPAPAQALQLRPALFGREPRAQAAGICELSQTRLQRMLPRCHARSPAHEEVLALAAPVHRPGCRQWCQRDSIGQEIQDGFFAVRGDYPARDDVRCPLLARPGPPSSLGIAHEACPHAGCRAPHQKNRGPSSILEAQMA